jgi:hypothetical protein
MPPPRRVSAVASAEAVEDRQLTEDAMKDAMTNETTPHDFAALGRLDAEATPEPWKQLAVTMVARSDRGFLPHDRALIAALRNAHDAYRACVLALAELVARLDMDVPVDAMVQRARAALARFTNITEDGA